MRLPGPCLAHGKPHANPCADNSSSFNYLSGVPKHPFRACASQTLHLSPFLHQNPLCSPLRLRICSCSDLLLRSQLVILGLRLSSESAALDRSTCIHLFYWTMERAA